jgi:hypothetical protein
LQLVRRNNPEDTILHSHRRENLKSYIVINIKKQINLNSYKAQKKADNLNTTNRDTETSLGYKTGNISNIKLMWLKRTM